MEDFIRAIVGGQDFTTFLLTTAATVATTLVGIVAFQVRKLVISKLSETDLTALNNIAAVAVTYIEQKFRDLDGPVKYAAAEKTINDFIATTGLKVTAEQLRALIESAVFTEINSAPGNDPVEPALPYDTKPTISKQR